MWESILSQDLGASPLARTLLVLRGYGSRAFRARGGTFPERLERFGFTKLAEQPGSEIVFGLAGKFWQLQGGLRPIAGREAFRNFAEDGCVKAAWNLLLVAADGETCDLSTETRIQYFGSGARRRFRAYWFFVRPFSGLHRRSLLRSTARHASRPMV